MSILAFANWNLPLSVTSPSLVTLSPDFITSSRLPALTSATIPLKSGLKQSLSVILSSNFTPSLLPKAILLTASETPYLPRA